MTYGQILKQLNAIKPHQYDAEIVLGWINALETAMYNDVLIWHADLEEPQRLTQADVDEEILVPDGYEAVYINYLIAQIDYANGEIGRYNNSMVMANAAFENWANMFNRQARVLHPAYIRGAK